MRIVQITTDSREHFREYERAEPYFGTAPAGLLAGFTDMPGVEVHVISCTHAAMAAPAKIAPNIWFHQAVVGNWGWGRTLFAGCIKATRSLIREINPDIVHGQGTERDCAISAVLSGFPNVLTLHGNMRVHAKRGENRHLAYYKLAAAMEGFCLRRTDGVVAISCYTENLVKDDAARTWLLPNAVNADYFSIRPEPPEIPRLLFVGGICERKNPVGLIEACRPLLEQGACTISFAGHGDPSGDYWSRFRNLLENVPGLDHLGFLDHDGLGRELARSSIMVLPTFEDNCPMVVLEAMAAGVPVAASRVGGVPDLVTHDSDGLMFDPHDPANLRATLDRLIREPETRRRLAAQGRLTAMAKFHPRIIAAEHLRIYQEILAS